MRELIAAALAAVLSFSLASCAVSPPGAEAIDPLRDEVNGYEGVSMEVVFSDGFFAEVKISNGSESDFVVSGEYWLQKIDAGNWSTVFASTGKENSDFSRLPREEELFWTLDLGKLEHGVYRVVKELLLDTEDGECKRYFLSEEFAVVD